MKIQLRETPFNPWEELQAYQAQQSAIKSGYGAASIFVGTMRDFNQNKSIQSMYLEHYPGMTDQYLHKLADEALNKWDVLDIFIIHRYGSIMPADTIVLLAVWSAHRDAAFSANRYLIEELKTRAPLWKKETLLADNSTQWVIP